LGLDKLLNIMPIDDEYWVEQNMLQGFVYSHRAQMHYQNNWRKNLHRNTLHLELLKKINNEINFTVTILKGAALLNNIYEDIGERFMSDLDILVSEKDLNQMVSYLCSQGFEVGERKTWSGNSFKIELSKEIEGLQINVELHTKLFFHLEGIEWKKVDTAFMNVKILSSEDMLIHLVGHYVFQHTLSKFYWYMDIHLFMQKYEHELNWEYIINKARKTKLYRSFQVVLWLYCDSFKEKYGFSKPSFILTTFLKNDFHIYYYKNPIRYFIIKHLVKDSLFEALKYDFKWILHRLGISK
jgi:hypothetical protein